MARSQAFVLAAIATAVGLQTAPPLAASQAETLPPPWHWQTITGVGFTYVVQQPVTLRTLAARCGLSATDLSVGNCWPIDRPAPVGSRLWLSNQRIAPSRPDSGGLVNIPEGHFDLFLDGISAGSWPVSVGTARWPTPIGRFPLGRPVWHPVWYVPASIRAESALRGVTLPEAVPPGPGNPLGEVWLGLGTTGVGLHGMTADAGRWPDMTGSHGCLRLAPAAALQVARLWRPGLTVDVVYLRSKCLETHGERFLEVHPDPYGRQTEPSSSLAADPSEPSLRAIWEQACGWPVRWPR